MASAAATVGALGLVVLLAIRPLRSPDLGYHLAYGETFLTTGRIVDHNEFIYTLPTRDADRPAPGPGCWYDAQGRYRFPNANWGSQVVFAAVYRRSGAGGLCALQAGLVAAIFLILLAAMRRLGVPMVLMAAGILLTALTAYMRFNLRPEVFGYLLLVCQFYLLAGPKVTWRTVVGLIALQVLFVNTHSYFLLGMALTGAFLIDSLGRIAWRRIAGRSGEEGSAELRGRAMLLGVALGGQVVGCFVNPWTWRGAVLPLQTLLYMRAHDIAASDISRAGAHPWSHIGEFFRPFAGASLKGKSTYAYCVVLALGAAGGLAAVVKRRWAWALVIAGMVAVSLSMRRNIAPAALLIVPAALAGCSLALAGLWKRLSGRLRARFMWIAPSAILLAVGWFGFGVISQRFHCAERSSVRFGWGLSPLDLPVEAARWIAGHPGKGRLWTGYTSSSNFHYFTRLRAVPILTNTWAYPPDVMRKVLSYTDGRRPFREAAREYAVGTVALRVDLTTAPLARDLARESGWALVYLDARHAVFRRTDALTDTVASEALTEETLDLSAHIEKLKSLDPVPGFALHLGGMTLFRLGWYSAGAEVFAAAVADDRTYHQAWNMRGVCLAKQGSKLMAQTGDKALLREAAKCFRRALELDGDYEPARTNLKLVTDQIRSGRPRVQIELRP